MTTPNEETTPLTFTTMGLHDALLKSLGELGYESPTPIQQLAIPHLLEGRDIIAQAQTGTGKTAAFALPLLGQIDLKEITPQLLILAPTRELALQVSDAIKAYSRHFDRLKVLPVYGGQGMSNQLRALKRGVHVVVGTPGRLIDHLERGTLTLTNIKALVLDEADEMLRMGFVEEVEKIMEQLPEIHQTALFSATMPPPIARIAKRFLKDPIEVRTKNKETTVEAISQYHVMVTGEMKKLEALIRLLEMEDFDGMIVFVRTRVGTVELANSLEARGYGAQALNGDMSQQLRQRTVDRFKGGDFDILVCTDVAARGLDVPRISHVLNFDIPFDTEVYVHRIGRTGRAGREGKAILFAGRRERRMLSAIERATRKKIERMSLPTAADLGQRRIAQFKTQLSKTIDDQDLGRFESVIQAYCAETGHTPSVVAAALTFLAQQNRPFLVEDLQLEDAPRGRQKDSRTPQRKAKNRPGSMAVYRIEVGSENGLEPKHLVGAITNEIDLPSEFIGTIRVGTKHTTVELPAGMPDEVLDFLQNVRVCGQRMKMSLLSGTAAKRSRKKGRDGSERRSGGPRSRLSARRNKAAPTRPNDKGSKRRSPKSKGSKSTKSTRSRRTPKAD